MDSRDEDGLSTDPVHVDAGACLQVVQVDVAELGDEVDHIVLAAHLSKGGREGEKPGRGERGKVEGREGGRKEGGREEGREGRT